MVGLINLLSGKQGQGGPRVSRSASLKGSINKLKKPRPSQTVPLTHARERSSSSAGSTSYSSDIPSPTESLAERIFKFKPFRPKSVIILSEPKKPSSIYHSEPTVVAYEDYREQETNGDGVVQRRQRSTTLESMSLFTPFRDAEDDSGPSEPNSPEVFEFMRNVQPAQQVCIFHSGSSQLWVPDEAEVVDPFIKAPMSRIIPATKANARFMEKGHRRQSVSVIVPPTEISEMLEQRRRSKLTRARSTDWNAEQLPSLEVSCSLNSTDIVVPYKEYQQP